jgi:hypothetical protein
MEVWSWPDFSSMGTIVGGEYKKMDWWLTWRTLHGVFAFGAMLLTVASIIVVWRMRGILSWKRSLRNELKGLNKEAEAAGETLPIYVPLPPATIRGWRSLNYA